jgi:hypothetical protein
MTEAIMLSLNEISNRTGVPVSLVRYAVNHNVIGPDRYRSGDKPTVGRGRGHARAFSVFSSFTIALAAVLLGAGLKRELVRKALDTIFGWAGSHLKRKGPAVEAFVLFTKAPSLVLEIGDGQYARAVVDDSAERQSTFLPGGAMNWTNIDTGKPLVGGYQPVVTVQIRLASIAESLKDAASTVT